MTNRETMSAENRDADLRVSFKRMLDQKHRTAEDLREQAKRAATPGERDRLLERANGLAAEVHDDRAALARAVEA